MSLQVWITGNNSMDNQGLLGDLTQTTEPTYVNGKIGKALATGGCKMTAEQAAQVLNNNEFSICFWIYVNVDTGAGGSKIFGNGGMGESNNRKFFITQYPTANDLHVYWMNDSSSGFFIGGSTYGVLPSYEWTHVAITYNNPTAKVYINGELKNTYSGASTSASFEYATEVIASSELRYFNDYRIYNNCLSVKEISEIYKGLCLHYKLSNQYEIGLTNKYSGTYSDGKASSSDLAVTALTDEHGYNYKINYTGTGDNHWKWIVFPTFTFTAGKTYFYSCKVRCRSTNFGLSLRAARSSNDYTTKTANVLIVADGEWHEYYVSQTIDETYDRNGSTNTSNPLLEFCTENLLTSGKEYYCDFDMKDVQVIESDEYVPFIENSLSYNTISDCSGLGNDGTVNGSVAWSNDSPRYKGCYSFDGSSYILSSNDFWKTGSINNVTIAMWMCPTKTTCGGAGGIMFNDSGAPIMSMYNTLWQFYNGSTWFSFDNGGITVNEWAHYACSLKDKVIKIYKNGVLISTNTVSAITTTLNSSNFVALGCDFPGGDEYFYGKLSDFRIYLTALSDEDIKQLYDTPISLDNKGELFASEFEEV